jgi:pSer/pThr/pTyr-binding forkhead associated (FHA) protein
VLEGDRLSIGRAAEADVSFTDDSSLSRLHCALERYPGGWVLRDLGSTNGTLLNGERLVGERRLQHGDEIRIGSHALLFRSGDPSTSELATIRGDTPPTLTRREHEVLVALCRPLVGHEVAFSQPATVADIAASLYIGESTVKFHLDNLYDKFGLVEPGASRRLALANEALRRGALTLGELRRSTDSTAP